MNGKITGALREQSDWAQNDEYRLGFIKNKPFYDTRKQKERVITCSFTDFNMDNIYAHIEGLVFFFKISDMIMTVEDFGQMIMRMYMNGELIEEATSEEMGGVIEVNGGYACGGCCMYLEESKPYPNVTLEPGMYYAISEDEFDSVAQAPALVEMTFPSVTTGELKTIDPKFLPEGAAPQVIDLDTITSINNAENLSAHILWLFAGGGGYEEWSTEDFHDFWDSLKDVQKSRIVTMTAPKQLAGHDTKLITGDLSIVHQDQGNGLEAFGLSFSFAVEFDGVKQIVKIYLGRIGDYGIDATVSISDF